MLHIGSKDILFDPKACVGFNVLLPRCRCREVNMEFEHRCQQYKLIQMAEGGLKPRSSTFKLSALSL